MRRGKKDGDQLTMPRKVHSHGIEAIRVDFMKLKRDAKESAQALCEENEFYRAIRKSVKIPSAVNF